jgi:phage terminase large subunit-like protein
LSLPALDDNDNPLWPEKFGREALERIRLNIGSRAWDALYMQKPTAEEGSILKRHWWRRYISPPTFSYKIQAWDTAFQEKTSADYSVCETWGVAAGGYYLLDVWRKRVE